MDEYDIVSRPLALCANDDETNGGAEFRLRG